MNNGYRTWAMALHLSVFASYIVPIAGVVAPIVIWQVKKAEFPEIDLHGKIVANYLITLLIYGFLGFLLCFCFVGIPLLIALGIAAIILPIVGAVKASNGEAWPYPGVITFFK